MRRALPRERIDFAAFDSGLPTSEAIRRAEKYGQNIIAKARQAGIARLAVETLRDPMLWFLFCVAILYALTGEWQESLVLLVAILPLTGMDAYLHWRTAAATKTLQGHLSSTVRVMRDGQRQNLASTQLVPGDILIVEAGESIGADGIVVAVRDAQVDESPLTGESLPVRKDPLTTMPRGSAPPIDGRYWAFAGTKVLTGEIKLAVVFTGAETVYGEIIQSVVASSHEQTPLQRAIALLVKRLIVVASVFCLMLGFARLLQGKGLVDALVSSATLALAAIPEEFPVVFTFFLGVGVFRMARRKALVRRAVSVENIGRVTCICSDKTGTLTEGRLRLAHLFATDQQREIQLRQIAVLASRADSLDPVDQTILEEFGNGDVANRLATFPFTEVRRREVSATKQNDTVLIAAKGAPEMIFSICDLSKEQVDKHREMLHRLARDGHKVLACASLTLPVNAWQGEEPVSGFDLVGLLAFEDPARAAVPAAIKACQDADIHVLMITGDHPDTARAIACEIGLGDREPRVYSAEDPDFSNKTGDFFVTMDVVARAMPAQKLAIVKALRARGEVVAVTGDGINDVPALQTADIGIAMGERGTKSAREVAAIVLVDDNFANVAAAIAEGRQLLENLRRSFQYLIVVHIPLVVTAAVLPLWGMSLLYLPIHIVWIELVIHPTAMLAFQEPANAHLRARARDLGASLLSAREWLCGSLVGLALSMAISGFFLLGHTFGLATNHARSLAIATLLLGSGGAAAMSNGLRTAAARTMLALTVLSVALFTEVPALSRVFHLSVMSWHEWLLVGCVAMFSAFLSRRLNRH